LFLLKFSKKRLKCIGSLADIKIFSTNQKKLALNIYYLSAKWNIIDKYDLSDKYTYFMEIFPLYVYYIFC